MDKPWLEREIPEQMLAEARKILECISGANINSTNVDWLARYLRKVREELLRDPEVVLPAFEHIARRANVLAVEFYDGDECNPPHAEVQLNDGLRNEGGGNTYAIDYTLLDAHKKLTGKE